MVNPPAVAGCLRATWKGIHRGTVVGVAMGDMQCAILAAQPSFSDAGIKHNSLASQHNFKTKCENGFGLMHTGPLSSVHYTVCIAIDSLSSQLYIYTI